MAEPKVIFGRTAEPSTVQLCPVCRGRGTVPAGFYGLPMGTSAAEEKCRACDGKGYLHFATVTINGGQRASSIERLKALCDFCRGWTFRTAEGNLVCEHSTAEIHRRLGHVIEELGKVIAELES